MELKSYRVSPIGAYGVNFLFPLLSEAIEQAKLLGAWEWEYVIISHAETNTTIGIFHQGKLYLAEDRNIE